jgi:NAD-dependent dihydropyrimidine dehydrogenase PreA subunit
MKTLSGAWTSLLEYEKKSQVQQNGRIRFAPEKCRGIWQCCEVCPVGCWSADRVNRKAVFQNGDSCIGCGACVLQCPEGAITLE